MLAEPESQRRMVPGRLHVWAAAGAVLAAVLRVSSGRVQRMVVEAARSPVGPGALAAPSWVVLAQAAVAAVAGRLAAKMFPKVRDASP